MRLLITVAAVCSLTASQRTVAQPVTEPMPDGAPNSVVMSCKGCGTINSIREIQQPIQGQVSNAHSGALVGLVAYLPLGRGASETGPYVGAVGSPEWQRRTTSTSYEYTVRMDDGNYLTAHKDGLSDMQVGDRVRIDNGQIERLGQ